MALRLLFVFGFHILFSLSAEAGFDFIRYEASPIDLSTATRNVISYQFSAEYRSACTTGCTGPQNYRLAFSDHSIGRGSGRAPPISEGKLGQLIKGKVRFTTTGDSTSSQSKRFSAGNWSGEIRLRYSTTATATFSLRLHKKVLQALLDSGQNTLKFYLVGEDVESTHYYDTLAINIPLRGQDAVQITRLKDITLNGANLSGAYLDASITACVYSSTGNIQLDLDGGNAPGQPFQLSRTNRCDSPGHCVPYVVRIKTPTHPSWVEYRKKGDQQTRWDASQDEQCHQVDNITLQVRITGQHLQGITAGRYQDRLTITVTPS